MELSCLRLVTINRDLVLNETGEDLSSPGNHRAPSGSPLGFCETETGAACFSLTQSCPPDGMTSSLVCTATCKDALEQHLYSRQKLEGSVCPRHAGCLPSAIRATANMPADRVVS